MPTALEGMNEKNVPPTKSSSSQIRNRSAVRAETPAIRKLRDQIQKEWAEQPKNLPLKNNGKYADISPETQELMEAVRKAYGFVSTAV